MTVIGLGRDILAVWSSAWQRDVEQEERPGLRGATSGTAGPCAQDLVHVVLGVEIDLGVPKCNLTASLPQEHAQSTHALMPRSRWAGSSLHVTKPQLHVCFVTGTSRRRQEIRPHTRAVTG